MGPEEMLFLGTKVHERLLLDSYSVSHANL
jgi:hypothetical protein